MNSEMNELINNLQKASEGIYLAADIIGPTGPQGPTGPIGPTGPRGPIGPTGPQGKEGQQGPRGVTGPKGEMGPQGDEGLQGPRGATGPRGLQGIEGERGPQGELGPQGSKGDTGPQGPKGDTGSGGINSKTPFGTFGIVSPNYVDYVVPPEGIINIKNISDSSANFINMDKATGEIRIATTGYYQISYSILISLLYDIPDIIRRAAYFIIMLDSHKPESYEKNGTITGFEQGDGNVMHMLSNIVYKRFEQNDVLQLVAIYVPSTTAGIRASTLRVHNLRFNIIKVGDKDW